MFHLEVGSKRPWRPIGQILLHSNRWFYLSFQFGHTPGSWQTGHVHHMIAKNIAFLTEIIIFFVVMQWSFKWQNILPVNVSHPRFTGLNCQYTVLKNFVLLTCNILFEIIGSVSIKCSCELDINSFKVIFFKIICELNNKMILYNMFLNTSIIGGKMKWVFFLITKCLAIKNWNLTFPFT